MRNTLTSAQLNTPIPIDKNGTEVAKSISWSRWLSQVGEQVIIETIGAGLTLTGKTLSGGGQTFFELDEIAEPDAPTANKVRIYAEDDGAGKTRIMAKFSDSSTVQLAIQP